MCHHLNETKLLERKEFRSEEKSMGEHAFIRKRTRQRHTQIIKAENGKNSQVGGYSSLAKKVLERSALHNNIHGTSDKSQSKELFDEEGPKKLSKRIDAWPLEHDQAGRGARPEFSICMPKVGCSKVTNFTAPEDGNANMWSGAWNTTNNESCHGGSSQGSIILTIPCKDVWNKPSILAQGKDENARREAGDWPKWETLSNQSSEQHSVHTGTYHSKEPERWTSLQDCKNKENDSLGKSSPQVNYINGETDGLDMTLNQSNVDGWKQHNLIPSMSSIECWRNCRNSSTLLNDKAEKRIGGSSKDDVHQSHVDGGRQSSSIFNVMHRGGQNNSKCWSLPGNTKRETVGWPRWETVVTVSSKQCCNTSKGWAARDYGSMRKTGEESKFEHKYGNGNKEIVELDATEIKSYHDGRRHHNCSYTMSTKRGSSEVEDGKAKREAGEAGGSFDHNGLDGWGQSSPDICMVDRGSSCKSAFWDSTKFSNRKMETKGWHKGVAAVSKASRQCPNSQNRKGSCNQSQGRTTSEDADSLKENDGRNPDLDRCGDPRMQQSIAGSLSKSACWDTTEVGKRKDTSMWSKWGSTISETKRQCTGNQNRQDYSNQSQGCTALKDVDSLKKNVGMNLDIIRSGSLWMQQIDNGSLIMSTGWDIPEAGDEKKETGAWPKWGATMSVTSGQCPYSQKRQCGWNKFLGWNVSEDSDLQKEIGSMDPDLDQSGPSNKGSLSKIAGWDKAEVCNGKGVAGGRPKWDAAVSVTNVQCLRNQNKTDGLNKSQELTASQDGDSREGNNGRISDLDQNGDLQKEIGGRNPDLDQSGDQLMQNSNEGSSNKCAGWEKPEDCNGKREAGGWPKWDAALSATQMQCPSSKKRKGSWNQSQGRTNSQDGDSQKGNGGRNSDLGQTGDPPMQQSTKGSLSKSACWDTTEVGKQKDTSMWLKCGSTMSETKRQCTGNQNRQDYSNQSQGCTALKHVYSLKKNVGMNLDSIQSGSPWMQHIDNGSLIMSTGWDIPKAGNEKKETGAWPKWGATMSVTSGLCPYSQKRQCGWNKFLGWNASEDSDQQKEIGSMKPDLDQSGHPSNKGSLSKIAGWDKAEDCDGKEVSGECPKWDAAVSVTNAQCPRSRKIKDGWNESQGWTTSQDGDSQEGSNCRISDLDQNGDPEVGDFQKKIGGRNPDLDQDGDQLTQNNNEGSLSKCAGWEKPEDCNGKREAGGWPYWDVAPSATEMQSPSSQKRKVCWNQSQGGTKSQDGDSQKGNGGRNPELGQTGDTKDGYLQKEIGDRNPDLDQNGDSWMQQSSKGSLSKSTGWDKPEDCNGKEAGGWPKWDAVLSAIYEKCPSNQKRRGSWNQSQGWTASQDGDSRKGIVLRNTDLHHSGDPWIQHRPMTFPRCEWNKSSSWTASYGDSVIRDCRKKGSGSDQIDGESRKRLNPTVSSKVCWRKSGSLAVAEGSGSIREKGEWGVSSDFVNHDAFKQHRSALSPKVGGKRPYRSRNRIPSPFWKRGHYRSNERYIIGAVDVAKPYQYSPTGRSRRDSQLQQYSDGNLEELSESKKARCLGHGRQQRFDDPWKRTDHLQGCLSLSHGSPSKDVENNELRRHDRSCYELLKRRCSRASNCRYVTGGFPLKDEYKEMNNDTRDCTPQFCRRVDSHLGYNVPLKYFMKQDCGHSEEFDSSLPGMLHGSLEGKNSDYKPDDSMNVSKLSSWNGFKVCKATMIYPHSQTHPLRVDECFRAETIKSMVITSECSADQDVHQSTHDWKRQKNPSICHQNHLKHDSPSEIQNDYTNPTIQFKQNMQFNSQVPSSSTLNQSHQLILQHGSYRNEEVQNNEHQAMSKGESFRRNDNFYDTSLIQDLNVTETKTPQNSKSWNACHSEPVVVQDNGEKKIVSEVEKGDGARLGMVGMDDKGILMFKCALAGFVKEIIKPIWKEGRLSKDAHKTVVKKVVDKVVGVLGTSIPQTKERIDQYMSYSEHKLKKLAQDYMEVFINS